MLYFARNLSEVLGPSIDEIHRLSSTLGSGDILRTRCKTNIATAED